MFICEQQNKKASLSHCNQPGKNSDKTGVKANSSIKNEIWDWYGGIMSLS
jgi:hypothetical protein